MVDNNLSRNSYSRNQWRKYVGESRCFSCVESGGSVNNNNASNRASQTARTNNSSKASFSYHNLRNPFAEGGFRWVAKGEYTDGQRLGEACVC